MNIIHNHHLIDEGHFQAHWALKLSLLDHLHPLQSLSTESEGSGQV